jgi:hypothetical protein
MVRDFACIAAIVTGSSTQASWIIKIRRAIADVAVKVYSAVKADWVL